MNRNDEQSVIDAFVSAVYEGNNATATRAGKRLIKQIFDRGEWDSWLNICDGTLLRPGDMPSHPEERVSGVVGVEALEPFVSAERLNELQEETIEGESLTPEELAIWQKLAAEEILTANPDCDVYPLWSVRSVTHSDGRVALLVDIGGGYSFTEPWAEYIGGALTEEEALVRLRLLGFTDVEDLRARWKADKRA